MTKKKKKLKYYKNKKIIMLSKCFQKLLLKKMIGIMICNFWKLLKIGFLFKKYTKYQFKFL